MFNILKVRGFCLKTQQWKFFMGNGATVGHTTGENEVFLMKDCSSALSWLILNMLFEQYAFFST